MAQKEQSTESKSLKAYSLTDELEKSEDTVIMSGINALVRLLVEQSKADKKAGKNTAGFVSGYRGSPLGGLDIAIQRNHKLMKKHNIEFQPAVNEELGVTAVHGTQLVGLLPEPKFEGVFGMWYGKAPGVDRSGDAFKHANFTGVSHTGGVLAVAGDDPISKSSTIPSHSEPMLYHIQMPILFPGNVEEVLHLGRLGFEMSRYSGLWSGFKIVTDIADAFATVNVKPIENIIIPEFTYEGKPWRHTQQETLLPPFSLNIEREINQGRLEAAKLFAFANNINEIKVSSEGDKLGLIAAGTTYYALREALLSFGLDEGRLNEYGIRILKLGMTYPLDERIITSFTEGLEEVLVVEEKRSFIEMQIKEILFNSKHNLIVIGKNDEDGNELVKADGELIAKDILEPLGKRLGKYVPKENLTIKKEDTPISLDMLQPLETDRVPFYCSGCPHNISTQVPEGSVASAGIGCHTMVVLQPQRRTSILTQMGGEGVTFVGAQAFTNTKHMFQNLGDGTLFHSGSLAIRQAIAANANITYKILWNGVVAMTGAQIADGSIPLHDLTRSLQAEGVKKIIVCGPNINDYPRGLKWAKNVKFMHRDEFDKAQEIMRNTEGVTALIYDQECTNNLRRLRKRGKAEIPKKQVFINEAICEGCGDCGVKSNCLSVFPVETEFGRKTQIHQSSCNRDYTCLKGDCPAFITIEQKSKPGKADYIQEMLEKIDKEKVPTPTVIVPDDAKIFMTGIGGTGVVTITRILTTAALLDGKYSTNLDQTGLSQKGGSVVAHIKLMNEPYEMSNRIADGDADIFLLFDLLSGTEDKNLKKASKSKTVVVASSSRIPSGKMVSDIAEHYPEDQLMISRLESYTKPGNSFYIDSAELAENLFGSYMYANMITVGAAMQRGTIPISFEALIKAIELNGVAAKNNQLALKIGRMMVHNPDWFKSFEIKRWGDWELKPEITPEAQELINKVSGSDELTDLLNIRIPELIEYQNLKYAAGYMDLVESVWQVEKVLDKGYPLTETVARYYFKLKAYKDEYEVARLYVKPNFNKAIEHQFGENAKVTYQLHPPSLRAIGFKNKIGFGKWFKPFFKLLFKMRTLRGTMFDIFGYAKLRKTERKLIVEYRDNMTNLLKTLNPENRDRAIQIAELPDVIRGFEYIKEDNIELYEKQLTELLK